MKSVNMTKRVYSNSVCTKINGKVANISFASGYILKEKNPVKSRKPVEGWEPQAHNKKYPLYLMGMKEVSAFLPGVIICHRLNQGKNL